ncbi:MAG TPA: VWA domain-containing protein [Candidatus Acidoferrales bacterium]|nr:VWA domain-containing protein [Candidatus Acidoferrales bacterium]
MTAMGKVGCFLTLLLLNYLGGARVGVTSADNFSQTPETINRVDLMTVVFTVTDKNGRFIKDLKPDQFRILDNHKPPQEIASFESQAETPLRIGLLFDASNSIRDRFLFEQRAAGDLLRQIIRPQSDQAFVLAFDEVSELTQDFTNDVGKLIAGIQRIRPGGGTALWDAVFYACRDKMLKEKNSTPVRRAIILVSSGDDNQSRVLPQEAIEMAQRADVIIYTVSTDLSNIQDTGNHNLKVLADATGGQAFFPFKLQDLSNAFADIQAEFLNQYSMSYKPDGFQPNGQFRTIQIIPGNTKLKVRVRKGYFAPKD